MMQKGRVKPPLSDLTFSVSSCNFAVTKIHKSSKLQLPQFLIRCFVQIDLVRQDF